MSGVPARSGRMPAVTRRMIAHARWCERMRLKCARKKVAHRLGISRELLGRYLRGVHTPLEDRIEAKDRAKSGK